MAQERNSRIGEIMKKLVYELDPITRQKLRSFEVDLVLWEQALAEKENNLNSLKVQHPSYTD